MLCTQNPWRVSRATIEKLIASPHPERFADNAPAWSHILGSQSDGLRLPQVPLAVAIVLSYRNINKAGNPVVT
jgi:hypothetical protein